MAKETWVHANIQGIARNVSMPPLAPRLAGRDPILRPLSSCSGVMERKYSTKLGVSYTIFLYAAHEFSDMRCITYIAIKKNNIVDNSNNNKNNHINHNIASYMCFQHLAVRVLGRGRGH